MADQESKDRKTAAEPPKPVHIGGESLVDRIVPHIKKILIMVVLGAVVVSVFLVVRWRKEVQKEGETDKLAEVLDVARRPVGPAQPEIPGLPAPKTPAPRFATEKERADAVLDAMVKAGAKADASYKAAMLFDAGKLDEAITEYKSGQGQAGLEGVLCREGLGIALEAKATAEKDPSARQKLLEDALAAFVAMQPDEAGPRRAYALYHQGRIQLTLGKRTEAKAAFEKAKTLGASTDLPEMIERRLATI